MHKRSTIAALALVLAVNCAVCVPVAGLAQHAAPAHTPPSPEARIDINHASLEQLLNVPGMTQTWATRIVRFRPYRGKQDLVERGVVTGAVYQRIKDFLVAHREPQ